jgi:hypothetical protein
MEEIEAAGEKNRWRAILAERSLEKQAKEAKAVGNEPLSNALSQRAKRASWLCGQIEEAMIGYVIGDPPDGTPEPVPEARLRRRDFQR